MDLIAVCHDCRKQHRMRAERLAAFDEWQQKHPGHHVEYRQPGRFARKTRSWQEYLHNSDIKQAFASSAALTLSLASLASSATLVAGRESTAVDNTANLYLDYLLGGRITCGTTPTAGTIEVWAYGQINDTPTYPDVLDGTDSAETMTTRAILVGSCKLVASLTNDTTSNQVYWFGPISVAALFGGSVPKRWGVFVTHSSVAVLHATAGNHVVDHTGVYSTVI